MTFLYELYLKINKYKCQMTQLINEEEITKINHCHFIIPIQLMDIGNEYQWSLMASKEK